MERDLYHKLRDCSSMLKEWSKAKCWNSKKKIKVLKNRINELQEGISSDVSKHEVDMLKQ